MPPKKMLPIIMPQNCTLYYDRDGFAYTNPWDAGIGYTSTSSEEERIRQELRDKMRKNRRKNKEKAKQVSGSSRTSKENYRAQDDCEEAGILIRDFAFESEDEATRKDKGKGRAKDWVQGIPPEETKDKGKERAKDWVQEEPPEESKDKGKGRADDWVQGGSLEGYQDRGRSRHKEKSRGKGKATDKRVRFEDQKGG